jgi:thiol:disulfide interchange protein DsbD
LISLIAKSALQLKAGLSCNALMTASVHRKGTAMRLLKALLLALTIGLSSAHAAGPTLLPAEQAFVLAAERSSMGISLRWTIAPDTYLYREHIAVRGADGQTIEITTPSGTVKDDPNFGPVEIYHDTASATIPAAAIAAGEPLTVSFQGCTDSGLCYPPVHRTLDVQTLAVVAGAPPTISESPRRLDATVGPADGSALLRGGSLGWTILAFLGFGLLLSLTPCVYPMVPILVGILVGPGGAPPGWKRGLALSGAYVLAMASAYAALGVAAAWSGVNLQAVLQAPWALGLMAAVLVVLALGMFGTFELSLPSFAAGRGGAGGAGAGILRAAGLGFGAALIVGPCVTPPLAAALIYIAQSGDLAQGAAALFALGLGIGMPLILVGTFGAHLLPRSGVWLLKVRHLFGFVMVGTAIVLIARVIPGPVTLLLWAGLALALGVFLGAFDRLTPRNGLLLRMIKAAGLLAVIYGGALAVGASAGGNDPLRPLAGVLSAGGAVPMATIESAATVTSPEELASAIAAGPANNPVLVQFTADWCTICKDIERDVLSDAAVRASLSSFTVIKADVTRDAEGTRALMNQLQVVGPPTLLVLDVGGGRELAAARVTGMTSPEAFVAKLAVARAPRS